MSSKLTFAPERRAGFTAGPWSARPASYGFDIFVSDKPSERALWIASLSTPLTHDQAFYPSKAEVAANADLIAAAPDLFTALEHLVGWLENGGTPEPWEHLDEAHDALAKARGDPPIPAIEPPHTKNRQRNVT